MNTPLVSVVMPTYNRADMIEKAINSLKSQSFNDWELIVIDDGSNDNTSQIIKKLQKNDKRIKYVKSRHVGSVTARKKGILSASGKIVTFLDSDDWYLKNHLLKNLQFLEKRLDLGFIRGVPKILGPKYVSDARNKRKKVHLRDCSVFGTFFIRKSVIKKIKDWPKHSFGDDHYLFQVMKSMKIKSRKIKMPSYIMNRQPHPSITLCHDKLFLCDPK